MGFRPYVSRRRIIHSPPEFLKRWRSFDPRAAAYCNPTDPVLCQCSSDRLEPIFSVPTTSLKNCRCSQGASGLILLRICCPIFLKLTFYWFCFFQYFPTFICVTAKFDRLKRRVFFSPLHPTPSENGFLYYSQPQSPRNCDHVILIQFLLDVFEITVFSSSVSSCSTCKTSTATFRIVCAMFNTSFLWLDLVENFTVLNYTAVETHTAIFYSIWFRSQKWQCIVFRWC